jgi:hypothetical protein
MRHNGCQSPVAFGEHGKAIQYCDAHVELDADCEDPTVFDYTYPYGGGYCDSCSSFHCAAHISTKYLSTCKECERLGFTELADLIHEKIFARCETPRRSTGKRCGYDAIGYCKACNHVRCGVHAAYGKCNSCRTELLPLRVFATMDAMVATLYPRSVRSA